MKIEIIITDVIADAESEEIYKMQECVKTGELYKEIKLISYECLNLGTERAMPFDAIKFIGTL
jgi:hypothetical protein